MASAKSSAGSDVATTSSYQASYELFDRAGISESQATGLLRRSVQLALQACQEVHAGETGLRLLN